jgi:DNA-binding transcriptional ArsR family regulator
MDENQLVKMFKALGNPNRYRLFDEIRKSGSSSIEEGHSCFLNTIIDQLNVGAPTISHHLKELVNAGLVETEKDGKFLQCRLNQKNIEMLREFISSLDN